MIAPAIGLGLVLTVVASAVDLGHLVHAMLAGIWFATMLGIGALVFVLGQQALAARSAVVPRRSMEWVASGFAYAFVAAAALGFAGPSIYTAWWSPADAGGVPRWFGSTAFWLRMFLYLFILAGVGTTYMKKSAEQDVSGDPGVTAKLRKRASVDLVLVFLVVCGLATEWILSLHARELVLWVVPLAGAYLAAGGLSGALALALIAMVLLERAGVLEGLWSTADRRRLAVTLGTAILVTAALGALLVWATTSFAPAMAAAWSPHWLSGSWRTVTWVFLALHLVTFVLLLTPLLAGRPRGLLVIAAAVLLGRYLEAFQLVLPVWSAAGPPRTVFFELVGLAVGLAAPWVAFFVKLTERPVVPLRDPLLAHPRTDADR